MSNRKQLFQLWLRGLVADEAVTTLRIRNGRKPDPTMSAAIDNFWRRAEEATPYKDKLISSIVGSAVTGPSVLKVPQQAVNKNEGDNRSLLKAVLKIYHQRKNGTWPKIESVFDHISQLDEFRGETAPALRKRLYRYWQYRTENAEDGALPDDRVTF